MKGLFGELNRRNVFRVAVTYLVAAWVFAQVAGLAADAFDAPAWVMQMIIATLVIGFFPAIIFAWIFELSPEGLKRERDLVDKEAVNRYTARRLDLVVIVLLVAAIGVLLADRLLLRSPAPALPSVAETPDEEHWQLDSIAVLPFADFSPTRDQAWLGEGIAETLLHALAQIDGLRVSARTSSFAYRDRAADVGTIGRELGVATVLEGSVQRAGERLRVMAQLVRTDNHNQIFSETFNRDADDIFAIQDEIAAAVAEALMGTAAPRQTETARTDVSVYDLYLEGRQLWQERTSESVDRAVALLEQALSIDPEYGPAHSELATALLFQHYYGEAELDAQREAIEHHLARALALNDNDPQAWATRGLLLQELGLVAEALETLKKAESLAPSDANIKVWIGNRYLGTSHFVEAAHYFERALELDPLNRFVRQRYAQVLGMINFVDPRIERIARDTVRLFPDDTQSWYNLLALIDNQGRLDEIALTGFEAHLKHPTETGFAWYVYSALLTLGEDDAAAAWMTRIKAIDPESHPWSFYYLRRDPERHLELARDEYERWGDRALNNLLTSLRINRRFDEAWELSERHLEDNRAAFEAGQAGMYEYNSLIEGMWLARQHGDEAGYRERRDLFMQRYSEIRDSDLFADEYMVPELLLAAVSGDYDKAADMLDDVPDASLGFLDWALVSDPIFEPLAGRDEVTRLIRRHEARVSVQREQLQREAPPELFDPGQLPPPQAAD